MAAEALGDAAMWVGAGAVAAGGCAGAVLAAGAALPAGAGALAGVVAAVACGGDGTGQGCTVIREPTPSANRSASGTVVMPGRGVRSTQYTVCGSLCSATSALNPIRFTAAAR